MRQLLLALLVPALITGCEDDISPQSGGAEIEDRQIVLGDKLPNPYSLSVMQQAADEMAAEESNLKSAQLLQATHRYLRFAPRDTAEIDLLESDSTIFFYTYPMDYEVVQGGDSYTDPDQPEGVLKYMYCAVSVDHELPAVPYDVLDDLYILEETNVDEDALEGSEDEDETTSGNKSAQAYYWEALEQTACKIVGAEVSTNKSKWRPQGDLYYHDTSLNKDIPLEGVPVRCRKSIFVTSQRCTDANGHFSFDKVRGHVTYYIRWRRDHFKIREHTGLPSAETNLKTHTKSAVSCTVTHGTRAWEYASIFRAAHFYYYKAKDYGLSSPTRNKLTIRPSSKGTTKNGHYCGFSPVFSDIHIYCIDEASAHIFCTTIHEIAHCVQQSWGLISFAFYSDRFADSWAGGVAWYLTGRVYDSNLYHDHLHYNKDYPGIVEDLVNKYGMSMSDVETAFKSCWSWHELRNHIKKLKIASDDEISNLFSDWENYGNQPASDRLR